MFVLSVFLRRSAADISFLFSVRLFDARVFRSAGRCEATGKPPDFPFRYFSRETAIRMLLQSVGSYIRKYGLLASGDHVVVGLSGGADSVALLDILVRLGYACTAVHCNFRLRGDESLRDERFAESLAGSLGVPFLKTAFDTAAYASEKRLSTEMAARELRYAYFERVRRELGAQAVAVAHHRDDSVETFLLNLLRGAGLRGLTGIRPRRGHVVRPLLDVSREDILAYLQSRSLTYVTDSTNLSDVYTRNFIRLRLLPEMTWITPAAPELIARTARQLADAETVYLSVIERARRELWLENRLDIKGLETYPAPATVLFELLRPYGFSRSVTEEIFRSRNGLSGKIFYAPACRLVKDRDFFLLLPNKKEEPVVYKLNPEGDIPELPIKLSFEKIVIDRNFTIEKNSFTGTFDYEKLTFPLYLRRWRESDRFVPFGMSGYKKLSDYFSDRKFSVADKENCWLLCSGKEIVWIIGERTDNRFRVDLSTKKALVVKFFDKNS